MTTTDKRVLLYTIAGSLSLGLLMLPRFSWTGRLPVIGDQPHYHTMGVNLARGYGFHCTGFAGPTEIYKPFIPVTQKERAANGYRLMQAEGRKRCAAPFPRRSPGFPVLLGMVYALGGWVGAAQSMQAILILMTTALIPALGYAWWKRMGAIAGVPAGAAYAWFALPLGQHLLTEPMTALWLTSALLCLRIGESSKRIVVHLGLGLLLGSAALVKDTLVPFMMLATIWLGIRAWRTGNLRRWFGLALMVILPALLWSWYLSIGNGRPIIITEQIPMTIRAAYNPESQQSGLFAPQGMAQVEGYPAGEPLLLPVLKSAARFALDHASSLPATIVQRWRVGLFPHHAWLLGIILLFAAGDAAGVLRPRGAYRPPADAWLSIASFALLTTLFFGLPRHWQTVEPVLFLAAAYPLVRLASIPFAKRLVSASS